MITGAQIRMARGYLRWSVKELADKAEVAMSTIKRMEQDEGFPIARGANIEAVYKTLAGAGIIFLSENGGGVGIRVQKIEAVREKPDTARKSTPKKMRGRRALPSDDAAPTFGL